MASRRAAILARRGATCIGSRRAVAKPLCQVDLLDSGAGNGEFTTEHAFSTLPLARADLSSRSYFQWSVTMPKNLTGGQRSAFHASSTRPVMKIGMPSLSPTMTQGNIAVWRKKEGDEVAAGDVLCEIETGKVTLEMESMEEGFLGKILVGDGAKDIPVGQAICLMVESEDELKTVGDYKVSGGGEAPSPPKKEESAPPPPPPKQEESKPAPSKPPPASPSPQPSGDRVFATPAARKLAEDKSSQILAKAIEYYKCPVVNQKTNEDKPITPEDEIKAWDANFLKDVSLLSSRFSPPTVDSLVSYGYVFREVEEELLSLYEKEGPVVMDHVSWESLHEFLSLFFAPSVVQGVLLNFLEMKDSGLGQEYFLRGGVAMLALRTLNDITKEFGELYSKYAIGPVQGQDWTMVTRSRSRSEQSQIGGGSNTQGGSISGGSRRGEGKRRRRRGGNYGGVRNAFQEVSAVEIILPACSTPDKHTLPSFVVKRTIGERSSLFNTKVQEYLQDTPSVGLYAPELAQHGFVFLFHGMRQSSWSSFCRFGIRPRAIPNEFSIREAFYLTNSVRHAFEHPLHQHPQRNTTDFISVLVFIVPLLVLHGKIDAPGDSKPFRIKWFKQVDAEWKDFCMKNMVERQPPNHSYDFVIGPTCLPAGVGRVRPLQIDGVTPTQIACCTKRARKWIASMTSTIYMEKRQPAQLGMEPSPSTKELCK